MGGSCFRAHAPAATPHDRQPKHPPAAQESPCAGVVIVYEPAGAVQQPYSETCSPFQAQQDQRKKYIGHNIKIWSFAGPNCTLASSMLLQHAAGSRHLPGGDRGHVTCTWRSKVGVGSLESACPPLEAGPLNVDKKLNKIPPQ